jgi:hypothetical protein
MAGFDLEGGVRLARFGESGDLRGYAGLYYYDAPSGSTTLGWKARLEARPIDPLILGLSLQDDDFFGTNLVFNVGFNFGGSGRRGRSARERVASRLGETVARQNNVVVDRQVEREFFDDRFSVFAINPKTSNPWQFRHVDLGRGTGDGTYENPTGTVQAALNVAQSDDIVYVNFGNNPDIPAFAIPDGVQVLSTGPLQEISASIRGIVQTVKLSGSGSGNFPTIREAGVQNLVTMGSNTTLSGFEIVNAGEHGILAQNVSNVTLRQNTIRDSGERGIYLNNVTGTAAITDSTITGSRGTPDPRFGGSGQGIFVSNDSGQLELTVARNQFDQNPVGIEAEAFNGVSQTATISDNTVSNSRQGIIFSAVNNATQEIAVSGNTVNYSDRYGISFAAALNATQKLTITDNTIRNNSSTNFPTGTGISVEAYRAATQEFTIQGNSVSGGGTGIGASAPLDTTPTQIGTIANNQITDTDAGIGGRRVDNLTIRENTITGAKSEGIFLTFIDNGTVEIVGNTITDSGGSPFAFDIGQGILLARVTGTVTIAGNTITGTKGRVNLSALFNSGQGILFVNNTGNVNLTISGNQIRDSFEDAILINLGRPINPLGIPSPNPGDTTANITISGNTIENNGNPTAVRGNGIAIELENNAAVNSLTISGNTIRGNAENGIDIRLVDPSLFSSPDMNTDTNATVRATITDNIIENHAAGQGINLQTNRITSFGYTETSRLDASVRQNRLTGNRTDVTARSGEDATPTNPLPGSTLCLQLRDNSLGTPFNLIQANNSTFQLEPISGNTNGNAATTTGIITSVAASICNLP